MKLIDISHHNGEIDFSKVKKDGVEAVIMKVTQGVSFVDDKFARNKKEARKAGLLCGFYHFADGGDYKKESEHFLKIVGDLQEGEFLALDFEINISNPEYWCKNWLDAVSLKMGFRPIFYTNEARVLSINFKPVAEANYGLWVAKYGDNDGTMNEEPKIGAWPFLAIWQYTSRGKVDGITGNVDLNKAYMNMETLKKYGKPKETEVVDYKELFEEEKTKREQAEGREAILKSKLEKIKEIIK